ncbi:MAG TPA: hypothetical protein VGB85_04870 [Nannocystis sp.]|jgi:hypothetical protein
MKPETEQRWRVHVAAWANSGLTCKAYAAKVGINSRTLTWWKSKLGEGVAPAAFVEVTSQVAAIAAPELGVVELIIHRVMVRLRGRVDVDALMRVLDVLEARSQR